MIEEPGLLRQQQVGIQHEIAAPVAAGRGTFMW
jgi:hypothetical protein